MIADLKKGNIDWADQVPFQAVNAVKKDNQRRRQPVARRRDHEHHVELEPGKPKNRELLDPQLKKALSMCVDRDQIIDVVFAGYASEVESIVGNISPLENPNLGPLVYDCEAANTALDKLGYTRGSNGIRVVPATTGANAQGSHAMSYEILTPTSTDFNVNRSFDIVKDGFARLGVKVTQKVGGDATATYAIQTGDCNGPESKQYRDTTSPCGTGWATSIPTSCCPS